MSTQTTTLIFSPHVDDEVLGCFSFLDESAFVLIAGVEERTNISRKTRIDELDASSDALGFKYDILDHTVNHYVSTELITPFEQAIERLKPKTVLLPVRSYNQDHRAVHDAAHVATRPHDSNWRVNRVLSFEQPHSEIWPFEKHPLPGFYKPINIEEKLTAYARYPSQVRGHRSPATVRALATLRGASIGEAHAEAFHVLRLIASA